MKLKIKKTDFLKITQGNSFVIFFKMNTLSSEAERKNRIFFSVSIARFAILQHMLWLRVICTYDNNCMFRPCKEI